MKKWVYNKSDVFPSQGSGPVKASGRPYAVQAVLALLSIFFCLSAMLSSAFAFLTVERDTGYSVLSAAYYSITVDKAPEGVYVCPVEYEDTHVFVLRAEGTATTGYCKVQVGDTVYYTPQIVPGCIFSLRVQAAKDTRITFTPIWGLKPAANLSLYNPTEAVFRHSETPYVTYRVEPQAKLTDIAAYYNVPETDILRYNNVAGLVIGIELKIPGKFGDLSTYAVPYTTYLVEPQAKLADIAAYYGVPAEEILWYNLLTEIVPYTILKIPGVRPFTAPYAVPWAVYVMEEGAMLENVALYYGVPVSDLLLYNGVTEVPAGFCLRIPGARPGLPPYTVPKENKPVVPDAETPLIEPEDTGNGEAVQEEEPTSQEGLGTPEVLEEDAGEKELPMEEVPTEA